MLLGNGDIGSAWSCDPTRWGSTSGKMIAWDIRVSEDGEEDLLPFADLLKLWQRASEEAKRLGKPDMLFIEDNIDFFLEYTRKMEASYGRPWPRPWPCGTVWIHWDSRWVEPRNQVLDLGNGLFTLELNCTGVARSSHVETISCFVDWDTGLISVSTGRTCAASRGITTPNSM